MSQRQILRTFRALVEDDERGLGARMAALAPSAAVPIRTEVHVIKWRLTGQPHATGAINVAIRPRRWTGAESAGGLREGRADLELMLEMFSGNEDEIEETCAIASVAVAQLVDDLRAFSDETHGTVIGLAEPGMAFVYGDYDGPTASGFTVIIPLEELGTE